MRVTYSIEPTPVIESGGFDYQRVAIPVADRISQPCRVGILRQLPSIHIDLPVAPGAALIEERYGDGRLSVPGHRSKSFRRTGRQGVRNGSFVVAVLVALRGMCLGR